MMFMHANSPSPMEIQNMFEDYIKRYIDEDTHHDDRRLSKIADERYLKGEIHNIVMNGVMRKMKEKEGGWFNVNVRKLAIVQHSADWFSGMALDYVNEQLKDKGVKVTSSSRYGRPAAFVFRKGKRGFFTWFMR
jgi:hypothetical protein